MMEGMDKNQSNDFLLLLEKYGEYGCNILFFINYNGGLLTCSEHSTLQTCYPI